MTTKAEIQIILNRYAPLAEKKQSKPANYPQLLNAAIQRETRLEFNKIQDMLNASKSQVEFIDKFKVLWRQRLQRNAGTCFSLSAMPLGICNQLYLEIARKLCDPLTWPALFEMLLGEHHLLEIDFAIKENAFYKGNPYKVMTPGELSQSVKVMLERKPLAFMQAHPERKEIFSELILDGDSVFDLNQIALFPFRIHRELYHALDAFPVLKGKLYNHNDALRQLHTHLEQIENKGLTPYEVIDQVQMELRLAGTAYTGLDYAAPRGVVASDRLRHYILSMPKRDQDDLMIMRGEDGITLAKVIMNLNGGECVETASADLRSILEENRNKSLLHTRILLTEAEYKQIKDLYQFADSGRQLVIQGAEESTKIPAAIVQPLLRKVIVETLSDLINLLVVLPVSEFKLFLKDIQLVDPVTMLSQFVSSIDLLGPEKTKEFIACAVEYHAKFGGSDEVFRFCLEIKSEAGCEQLLRALPDKVVDKMISTHHWFHKAAKNKVIYSMFLSRLSLQQIKDRLLASVKGRPMMYYMVEERDGILRAIADRLPASELLALLKSEDTLGIKVVTLLLRCLNVNEFHFVVNFFKEQQQLDFLTDQATNCVSWLMNGIHNPDKDMLPALITFINDHVKEACIIYDLTQIYRPALAIFSLEVLNQLHRLMVRHKKNLNLQDAGLLQLAVKNPDPAVYEMILNGYPVEKHFAAISRLDSDRMAVLHYAALSPNLHNFHVILRMYPPKQRLNALLSSKFQGMLTRIENKEMFVLDALYALTPEEQLSFIKKLLQASTSLNPQVLLTYLGGVQPDLRLQVISPLSNAGAPMAHWVSDSGRIEDLFALLAESPKQEQMVLVRKLDRDADNLIFRNAKKNHIHNVLFLLDHFASEGLSGELLRHDRYGMSMLFWAVNKNNHRLFDRVLAAIPANQRWQAMTARQYAIHAIVMLMKIGFMDFLLLIFSCINSMNELVLMTAFLVFISLMKTRYQSTSPLWKLKETSSPEMLQSVITHLPEPDLKKFLKLMSTESENKYRWVAESGVAGVAGTLYARYPAEKRTKLLSEIKVVELQVFIGDMLTELKLDEEADRPRKNSWMFLWRPYDAVQADFVSVLHRISNQVNRQNISEIVKDLAHAIMMYCHHVSGHPELERMQAFLESKGLHPAQPTAESLLARFESTSMSTFNLNM